MKGSAFQTILWIEQNIVVDKLPLFQLKLKKDFLIYQTQGKV